MHVNTYLESCRPRCCCCLLCSCRVMLRHRKQPALLSALNHAPRVCLPCVYHLLKLRKLSHPRDLTSYLPYALQSITVVLYTGYNRARMDATVGTAARHKAVATGGRRGTAIGRAGGTPGRIIMVVEASRAERAAPASATSRSWSARNPWRCTLPLRSSQAAPAILARHATP